MSAALQLSCLFAAAHPQSAAAALKRTPPQHPPAYAAPRSLLATQRPATSLAFYRKHTQKMLRRYLYASMLVGRSPLLLAEPVGRGWASSRPVRTFEDAVIFVLDLERCIQQLDTLDRQLLGRVVLQEYTLEETSVLLKISLSTAAHRFPRALDHLTEKLMNAGLLVLPE